jgi:hypothetical protein
MEIKKEGQAFFKGMNKDFSPAYQPEGTYRDALNMELTGAGEQMIINQIRSSELLQKQVLSSGYPIGNINILGYTVARAKIGTDFEDGFVVYCYVDEDSGSLANSAIYFFAQNGSYADGSIYEICTDTTSLNFQATGSIDSFFTDDRENKSVYFTDFNNTIRKIDMDNSLWPYASASSMDLISKASSAMNMSITSIGNDGALLAGTYQLAYRLKKTNPLATTKWSTFTNPVPAIPLAYTSGTSVNYYGGPVGQQTSRSINFSIPIASSEVSGNYNKIEIAVVKNNDGTYVKQLVAYVSEISNSVSSGAGTVTGTYKGTESEYELDIDEITAPDAPVETVKTLVEKDNRLLAGNIKYFDRRIGDGEAKVIEARTIRRAIDYENPINTNKYRGYFRDEVYRFGITYHDEYGNWSPVKPLDFSSFTKSVPKTGVSTSGTIASGGIDYNKNIIDITRGSTWPSGTTGYVQGQSVSCTMTIGSTTLSFESEIVAVPTTTLRILCPATLLAPYPSFTGTSGTANLIPLKGNAYSHSSDQFSWKFPKREHIGVSDTATTGTFGTLEYGPYSLLAIIEPKDLPQALGLGLSVSGHPAWAKGMAVVRMDRDRDIVYQTPIVPASMYVGACTQGRNPNGTNNDYTLTNGVGELDYLGPKSLKMGTARNMEVLSPNGVATGSPTTTLNTWSLPAYQGINSVPENRMMWKKCFAPAIDYVYNAAGTPLIPTPELVSLNLDIVDVCGFTLSSLTPTTTTSTVTVSGGMSISYPTGYVEARVYSCVNNTLHWYPNNYFNMKTQSSSGVSGSYETTYNRKIQESFLQTNGIQTASYIGQQKYADVLSSLASTGIAFAYYTRTLMDLTSLSTTELVIPITKGQSKILLSSTEQASSAGSTISAARSGVNYLLAGTDLTSQQRNASIDMSSGSTNSALWTSNIEAQRSLAISLNQFLDDPLYLITANYCPLSAGQFGYIPRDTTNTGRTNTFASVAFSQYLNTYNPTGGTNQLRNGLIYNNPFMNITWNGSAYAANSTYMPSYPFFSWGESNSALAAPIENVDGGVEFAYAPSGPGISATYFNKYSSPSTDIQQALYVANMRAGKQDSRYGDPNQIQEYFHTGAYSSITGTNQTVTLEVWGGDCFISKYRYKVNDEYNIPSYYIPNASGTYSLDQDIRGACQGWISTQGALSSRSFKTGTKTSPEYIEMYIEGEANAFYNSDRNRFPYYNLTVATPGTVGHYQADAFYNYNFGYSIENLPKSFFSENRLVQISNNYPARLIYSDVRSADLGVDGFSRFRALNYFDMDERYGKVTKIALLNDAEPIVGQDDAVSLLYVNKSLTTLQDNEVLTVQGGTYISENSPPRYLTTNYGVELIRCMIPTESGVYILDTKRGVLINILDGAKIVTLARMEEEFRTKFSKTNVPWLENSIEMSYDRVDKNLYIIGFLRNEDNPYDNQDTNAWMTYNAKLDAFVSNLDWDVQGGGWGGKYGNRPLYIFDLNGSTYMLQSHSGNQVHDELDLHINQWKGGNDYLDLLTGNHLKQVSAEIEYVFNKDINEPKVLDIVGINSQSLFSEYNVTAYNDTSTLASDTTGNQAGGVVSRLGMATANIIRGTAGKRLVGSYHTIKLFFSNTTSAINLRSAVNQFRKVFR